MAIALTCFCGLQIGIAAAEAEDGRYRDATALAAGGLAMAGVLHILGWLA